MSNLATRKSRLQFVTCDTVRERGKLREVIISAHRTYADIRLSGLRRSFSISYGAIYHAAAKLAFLQERANKTTKRTR